MYKYLVICRCGGNNVYFPSNSRNSSKHIEKMNAKYCWIYDKKGWLISRAEHDSKKGKVVRLSLNLDGEPRVQCVDMLKKFNKLAAENIEISPIIARLTSDALLLLDVQIFKLHNERTCEMNEKSLSEDTLVLQALKDVVVLTCTHESRFGADSFVSFHSSEKEAEKHAEKVAFDACYDESRDEEVFQIDIKHYDFSGFPDVKSLNIVQREGKQEENKTPEKTKYERAAEFVDAVVAAPDGKDLFFVSNIYYMLTQVECEPHLTRFELLKLTERLTEASNMSSMPLLTAERVDAVSSMLSGGIKNTRSEILPELTAEQAKKVLLNCDLGVFATIVDQYAVDNQKFYAPDKDDITGQDIDNVHKAISMFNTPAALDEVLLKAEQQRDLAKIQTNELTVGEKTNNITR